MPTAAANAAHQQGDGGMNRFFFRSRASKTSSGRRSSSKFESGPRLIANPEEVDLDYGSSSSTSPTPVNEGTGRQSRRDKKKLNRSSTSVSPVYTDENSFDVNNGYKSMGMRRKSGGAKPKRPASGIKRQQSMPAEFSDVSTDGTTSNSTSPRDRGNFFVPPTLNSNQVSRKSSYGNMRPLARSLLRGRSTSSSNLGVEETVEYDSSEESEGNSQPELGSRNSGETPLPLRIMTLTSKPRSSSIDSGAESVHEYEDDLDSFDDPIVDKRVESVKQGNAFGPKPRRYLSGHHSGHSRRGSGRLPVAEGRKRTSSLKIQVTSPNNSSAHNVLRTLGRHTTAEAAVPPQKTKRHFSRTYTEALPRSEDRTTANPPPQQQQLYKVGSFSGRVSDITGEGGMTSPRPTRNRIPFRYDGITNNEEENNSPMHRCSSWVPTRQHRFESLDRPQELGGTTASDVSSSSSDSAELPGNLVFSPPSNLAVESDVVFKFPLWEKKKSPAPLNPGSPTSPLSSGAASPKSSSTATSNSTGSSSFAGNKRVTQLSIQPHGELERLRAYSSSNSSRTRRTEMEQKITDSRDSTSTDEHSLSATNPVGARTPRNSRQRVKSPRSGKNVVENTTIRWSRGKLIGRGTYGEVYIALDCDSGKQFAVKTISKAACGDGTQAAKVQAEINVMRDLAHENIVQYIGSQTDPSTNTLEIFLEYVTGGSLAHLIKEHGPLRTPLVKKFTLHITKGVNYLHSREIIHRDIKGANVLITDSGVAKLADFGCSKQLEMLSTQDRDSTLHNIRGSIPWMAPEMIKQSGHDYPADIWSLGATVLEMATGKYPWPDLKEHVNALFVIGNTNSPPPMPESFDGTLLKDFLLKCFVIDPEHRAIAEELLDHPFLATSNF